VGPQVTKNAHEMVADLKNTFALPLLAPSWLDLPALALLPIISGCPFTGNSQFRVGVSALHKGPLV